MHDDTARDTQAQGLGNNDGCALVSVERDEEKGRNARQRAAHCDSLVGLPGAPGFERVIRRVLIGDAQVLSGGGKLWHPEASEPCGEQGSACEQGHGGGKQRGGAKQADEHEQAPRRGTCPST